MSKEKKETYGQIFLSWRTYWYAFVFVTLVTRGDFIRCFRIGDYGGAFAGVLLNPLVAAPVVALIRWNWQKSPDASVVPVAK